MSERLKKTPVWHKVFGVIETLALAACATGERIGLVTPTPEGTKTNPTEIVPTPSAGTIPTSAAETGTGMSVEFLGQDEVLATKLSETLTLENLYVKFKEDTQIKGLFANPDAVEYSAMGIKAHIAESGKTVSYPFFSAMSESEQKGYTAMVLQPSAEEVVYVVLNRITDAEGKVGLGITQDLNHQLLEKPVMIFATGLTTDQIARMTDEELARINLLFVPAGLPVLPSEAPLGVGNYLTSLKSVESTPTPEAIFVPEGFQVGELGLLQNPETGRNVLVMNPEADWERVREEIIGGLWQANMDWYQFTGEGSDALNYSTKEEFIKVAEEGKVLKIRIPVRDNLIWDKLDPVKMGRNYQALYGYRTEVAQLKKVEVRLDTIQVQILDANAFKEYLDGKDWLAPDQEAIGQWYLPSDQGNGALHFGVNEEGQLVISVGSYFMGDTLTTGNEFEIGRFGSELHEKYPTYFRSDGLGVDADGAVSYFFASMTVWLNHLPDGVNARLTKDGTEYKYLRVFRAQDVLGIPDMTGWYLNPPVFVFAK